RDSKVDAGCKSLISICFSKIAGAPIGSPQFLGSEEESMACALRRYGVTDSGYRYYSEKRWLTLREARQKSTASFQLLTRGPLPSSCTSR
ncbi:MAG: hypothetical protein P8X79_21110, partial [Reinekea sp.]